MNWQEYFDIKLTPHVVKKTRNPNLKVELGCLFEFRFTVRYKHAFIDQLHR